MKEKEGEVPVLWRDVTALLRKSGGFVEALRALPAMIRNEIQDRRMIWRAERR